jgi:hypothetical protein
MKQPLFAGLAARLAARRRTECLAASPSSRALDEGDVD